MRIKTSPSYSVHIILMLVVDVLVINQIIRFGTIPDYLSARVYGCSLFLSCLIMIWSIFREYSIKINKFQLMGIFLFIMIGFIGLANSNSLSIILASESGLLAFYYGHLTGQTNNDVYADLKRLYYMQWIIMAYFVVNDIVDNFTKIIQARSDVISANNLIYYGFPLLLLYRNKRICPTEVVLTLFIVAASAFSFKRTTLIAVVLSIAVYYIIRLKARDNNARKLILIPIFIITLFVMVKKIDDYSGGHISKRFSDVGATGGNHRTEIWTGTIESIKSSGLISILFGHGFNSVKELFGLSAHNDFIEIAYDFGVLGLLVYIIANIYVLSCINKARKSNLSEYPVFISTYIAFFVLSMFSHVFLYAFVAIPLLLFMGYLCQKANNGYIEKEKE